MTETQAASDRPDAAPLGQRYPLLTRMALVALSAVAAVGVGEVFARVTAGTALVPRLTDYGFLPGAEKGAPYGFRPGGTATFTWDGDPYGTLPEGAQMQVQLNRAGLRGPLPSPGQRVVLVVGDSFTFGEGVATADTFVAQTTARLANDGAGAPLLLNAGVPGYGTSDERYRFEAWLKRFKPKAAVLVYVPNDPIPVADSAKRGNDLMNRRTQPRRGLQLLSLLSRRRDNDATRRWYLSYYTGRHKQRWAQAKADIAAMAKASEASGVPFAVVYFPLLHEVGSPGYAPMRDLVAVAADAAGARFLDLTPALAAAPTDALWVHPTDHHPNARAHGLVAGALAPFVAELLR